MDREDPQTHIHRLLATLQGHESYPEFGPARALVNALIEGRCSFESEPWHALDIYPSEKPGVYLPSELLLRALDEEGGRIDHYSGITALREAGLHTQLDLALVLSGVSQALANDDLPVSLNISASSIEEPYFLPELHDLLERCFDVRPSDIVLEITEDSLADSACIENLRDLKKKGYRFALDDFRFDGTDEKRLDNLAPIVDFVKLDGAYIEAATRGDFDLAPMIEKVRKAAPTAQIITEWVNSPEEAANLRTRYKIDGAQGRNLSPCRMDFFSALIGVLQKPTDTHKPAWPFPSKEPA